MTDLSKKLGEMEEDVTESGTMLDVSMMEAIVASGPTARNARTPLLNLRLLQDFKFDF